MITPPNVPLSIPSRITENISGTVCDELIMCIPYSLYKTIILVVLSINLTKPIRFTDVRPSTDQAAEKYPDKTLEKNPLLTDAAQAVLKMGFLPKQVKRAIDIVLQKKSKTVFLIAFNLHIYIK